LQYLPDLVERHAQIPEPADHLRHPYLARFVEAVAGLQPRPARPGAAPRVGSGSRDARVTSPSWRARRCRSACAIISRWRSRAWRLCRFELIMPRPSALWLPESQARARICTASILDSSVSLPQRADRYRASTCLYQPLPLLLLLSRDGARYGGTG